MLLYVLIFLANFGCASDKPMDLVSTVKVGEPAKGVEKYNREKHFGKWRDQKGCQDTRAVLLIDKSLDSVQLNPNGCSVRAGRWLDPYTNSLFTDAYDLQIDHVVALRNAYYAGAHNWSPEKRCHYANFLGNDFNLIAVSGEENSKKSDYGPSQYVPPNSSYQCQFAQNILKIKVLWDLTITKADLHKVKEILQQCDAHFSQITSDEFNQQMQLISVIQKGCVGFP